MSFKVTKFPSKFIYVCRVTCYLWNCCKFKISHGSHTSSSLPLFHCLILPNILQYYYFSNSLRDVKLSISFLYTSFHARIITFIKNNLAVTSSLLIVHIFFFYFHFLYLTSNNWNWNFMDNLSFLAVNGRLSHCLYTFAKCVSDFYASLYTCILYIHKKKNKYIYKPCLLIKIFSRALYLNSDSFTECDRNFLPSFFLSFNALDRNFFISHW